MHLSSELLERLEAFLVAKEPAFAGASLSEKRSYVAADCGWGCSGSCTGSCQENCTAYKANAPK